MLIDVTATEPVYIDINKIFPPEIVGNGFDIVVTNPPFKNLKAERGHYGNKEEYYRDKDKYSAISKIVKKRCRYSTEDGYKRQPQQYVWLVSLGVTAVFFSLTYYFSGNPGKIVDIIGKYMTCLLYTSRCV